MYQVILLCDYLIIPNVSSIRLTARKLGVVLIPPDTLFAYKNDTFSFKEEIEGLSSPVAHGISIV